MKKNIILLVCGVLIGSALCVANLTAGTIKANGYNWKDLYSFLGNTVTLANELKTDHNNLVTAHNAAFNGYTAVFRALATQASYSAAKVVISARTLPSGAVSATTSASSLSLTQ